MRLAELAFIRTKTLSVLIWIKGIEPSKPVLGICFVGEIIINDFTVDAESSEASTLKRGVVRKKAHHEREREEEKVKRGDAF